MAAIVSKPQWVNPMNLTVIPAPAAIRLLSAGPVVSEPQLTGRRCLRQACCSCHITATPWSLGKQRGNYFNSLASVRSECHSRNIIFNLVLLIGIFRSSHDNALRWMPQDLTDDKSTLVQVMAWCRQAPSHYLSQCRLCPLLPYDVTRPQWVNSLAPGKFEWNFTFRYVILKWILVIDGWGISCEIALIWMSLDFTDDQSTLVEVMACCRLI